MTTTDIDRPALDVLDGDGLTADQAAWLAIADCAARLIMLLVFRRRRWRG